MTTWRATNPDGGHFPTGVDIDRGTGAVSHVSTSKLKKKSCQSKIKRQQTLAMASYPIYILYY